MARHTCICRLFYCNDGRYILSIHKKRAGRGVRHVICGAVDGEGAGDLSSVLGRPGAAGGRVLGYDFFGLWFFGQLGLFAAGFVDRFRLGLKFDAGLLLGGGYVGCAGG